MDKKFDAIRPYNDAEVVAATKRMAISPTTYMFEDFFFKDKGHGYLSSILMDIRGVEDFQTKVMTQIVERTVSMTTSGLSISGIENFRNEDGSFGKFLLISSHRDIVLDPAFVQIALFRHGMPLTEIAAGDNLIGVPSVGDLIRSNRMITVKRSGTAKELYNSAALFSEYIRERMKSQECSIWLAQKQGRSKDGHDATEQGVLKMLSMSGTGSFVEDFAQLRIMPMAVSYEYETCGVMKAQELMVRRLTGEYHKKQGEDLASMINGIKQFKGHVHLEFCKPLTLEELQEADKAEKNEKFRVLASIIDSHILPAFKLWPTNYIAADLLTGSDRYSEHYTPQQKEEFAAHIDKEVSVLPEVREILLSIYAAHLL
ncbi:MAG: 1-acyl-sn-glycerol-3-phosphate acyltransferase [Bacteroidales bacterium]|nr:1-acyl-sn-glycerol-3-phosphate acyltransferase [Bacteroidales bacterium]